MSEIFLLTVLIVAGAIIAASLRGIKLTIRVQHEHIRRVEGPQEELAASEEAEKRLWLPHYKIKPWFERRARGKNIPKENTPAE